MSLLYSWFDSILLMYMFAKCFKVSMFRLLLKKWPVHRWKYENNLSTEASETERQLVIFINFYTSGNRLTMSINA